MWSDRYSSDVQFEQRPSVSFMVYQRGSCVERYPLFEVSDEALLISIVHVQRRIQPEVAYMTPDVGPRPLPLTCRRIEGGDVEVDFAAAQLNFPRLTWLQC